MIRRLNAVWGSHSKTVSSQKVRPEVTSVSLPAFVCGALAARPPAARGRSRPLRGSQRSLRGRRPGPRDYIGRRRQSRRDTSDGGAPPRAPRVPAPRRSGRTESGPTPERGRAPRAPAKEGAQEERPLGTRRPLIALPPTQKRSSKPRGATPWRGTAAPPASSLRSWTSGLQPAETPGDHPAAQDWGADLHSIVAVHSSPAVSQAHSVPRLPI